MLDVSGCTALTKLVCYRNQIKDEGMDALIESLPTTSYAEINVIYNVDEQNEMTTVQVAAAKAKGWIPRVYVDGVWNKYAGSEPTGIGPTYDPSRNGGETYDLSGRMLQKMQKGINIVNGKKVLIK